MMMYQTHKIEAENIDKIIIGSVVPQLTYDITRVIAKAHNLTETLNDVTAHAEMQAITSAANYLGGKYLQNCTMYVTLEPCVMCCGALNWSQISKVVIGARDEQRGFINKHLSLHPKTEIVLDVLELKCSQIIKDFFRNKR